jgi:hypothetical protein
MTPTSNSPLKLNLKSRQAASPPEHKNMILKLSKLAKAVLALPRPVKRAVAAPT